MCSARIKSYTSKRTYCIRVRKNKKINKITCKQKGDDGVGDSGDGDGDVWWLWCVMLVLALVETIVIVVVVGAWWCRW